MYAEQRFSERQRGILRGAARLFKDKGYAETSVRDIAAAAGFGSGNLFYHFKNKEEILAAVIEWGVREALEKANYALNGARGPRERLEALSRSHLETLLGETGEAMAVTLYEWRGLDSPHYDTILVLRDEYEAIWQEVLDEASSAGIIPHGDVPLLRRFALGALNWTVQWYRPDGDLDVEDLTHGFMRLLLRR